jgi:hypothetical protein
MKKEFVVSSTEVKGMESKWPGIPENVPYKIIHFFLSLSFGLVGPGVPGSIFLVCRSARTRFMKRRSTFSAVLAEVSMNSQPNWRASAAPSSFVTSRSLVLSHLLPTSIKIGSPLLTRRIDWRKTSRRSKVDREAIEYTRMKPWPSLWVVPGISAVMRLTVKSLTEPTDHAVWHTPLR